MSQVVTLFDGEFSVLIQRKPIGNEFIWDYVKVILTLKEFVSEISHSEIQDLARNYISSYLDSLQSAGVSMWKIFRALYDSGSLGIEITNQYPQFNKERNKFWRQKTGDMTYRDALDKLSKLNHDLQPNSIQKLASAGELFYKILFTTAILVRICLLLLPILSH